MCNIAINGGSQIRDNADNSQYGLCNIVSDTLDGHPDCVDVFGPNLNFPQRPASAVVFQYNCDPAETTGRQPATFNLNGETECSCPAGKTSRGNSICFNESLAATADRCLNAGWGISPIANGQNIRCGNRTLRVSSPNYEEDKDVDFTDCYALPHDGGVTCATVFGATIPQNAPHSNGYDNFQRSYVYDCDPDGRRGLIPATVNTISALECECADSGKTRIGARQRPKTLLAGQAAFSGFFGGFCVDEVGRQKCENAGWTVSVDYGGSCGVQITLSGGESFDKCYFSGTSEPQCADVFGADFAIPAPTVSEEGATLRFVYNCDPTENKGLVPATINTISALECACPGGGILFGGACVCPDGHGIQGDVCVACSVGQIVQDGICTACPTGQGILADGSCGACTGGQEVQDGVCACTTLGQELNNGVCAPIQCPEGQKLFVDELYSEYAGCHDAEIVDSAEDCRAKDWVARAVNFGRANLFCDIPFTRYLASGGNVSDTSCIINPAESSTVANKCRDLFGNPSQFPPATGDADEDRKGYVTHCNAEGTIPGAIPATINLTGAKECSCDSAAGYVGEYPNCACPPGGSVNANGVCACASGSVVHGGACIPEEGDFGEALSDELLCGAFGGTVRTATGGREVCSGMDANDTFCIMDSAAGFPCRGLFKHLRSCNVQFNRKALNPFFCGEKCGAQKAVGSECR